MESDGGAVPPDSTPISSSRVAASRVIAIALLAIATMCTVAMWNHQQPPVDAIPIGLIAAAIVAITTRIEVSIGRVDVTLESVILLLMALVAPPIAPFAALFTALDQYPSHWSRLRNSASLTSATAVASLVTTLLQPGQVSAWFSAALASGLVFVIVNVGTVLGMASLEGLVQLRTVAPSIFGVIGATVAFNAPLVAGMAVVLDGGLSWTLVLILVPVVALQYFVSLFQRRGQLTDELAEKAQVLARTNLQFAAAMVKALDQRDAYTAGHSAAVAVYTRDIAREMGFDDETVRLAHLAGLLHDIGKIGVPGRVLNKQSPLDDEEFELMKTHAAMGAEILGEVELYNDIALLVRYHHERIDGKGYPDQLAGDAIPAISRMISVADTYSAMTTDRPYRDGMPTEKAMSILRDCRGTQLDSDFTDAFLRILIVADDAYQRGKQTEFEVEVAKHQALSQVEAEAIRIDAPHPAGPEPAMPVLPAAVDGELVEVELDREAA